MGRGRGEGWGGHGEDMGEEGGMGRTWEKREAWGGHGERKRGGMGGGREGRRGRWEGEKGEERDYQSTGNCWIFLPASPIIIIIK